MAKKKQAVSNTPAKATKKKQAVSNTPAKKRTASSTPAKTTKQKPTATKSKKTAQTCEEALRVIYDPNIENSAEAQKLIDAQKKLEIQLGLASADGITPPKRFGAEPYGASNFIDTVIREKMKDGKPTGVLGITIFVKRKPPKDAVIFHKIPESVDGIPTDVCVEGEVVPHGADFAGGKIWGQWKGGGLREIGTIGAVVHCSGTPANSQYILSNQHVLNYNLYTQEQLDADPSRSVVLGQDGLASIATLATWDTPDARNSTIMDAALALLTIPDSVSPLYLNGGGFRLNPPWISIEELKEIGRNNNDVVNVKKVGMASKVTRGRIQTKDNMLTSVTNSVTGVMYVDQYAIIPSDGGSFSIYGDSGSLVVKEDDNRPIALLWGGASSGRSFATPIEYIVNLWQIDQFL